MKTDEIITKEISEEIYWDDRVNANIFVEVKDGVVVLTGSVPNYRAKVAAAEDAELIPGVSEIRNELDITD